MQAYDILVLLLLIAATIWGARRGLAKQLATFFSLALGYFVAVNFRVPVAEQIQAPHPWNLFAAMAGLFVGTSFLVWVVFRFVKGSIEESGLTAFDAQMGGLLGLAKGIVLSMVITVCAVVFLDDSKRHAVLGSTSGYNICRLVNKARAIVPAEWQQAMTPYLDIVDEHKQHLAGEQPPSEEYPQPFELDSPSDLPTQYDDPQFGSLPVEHNERPLFTTPGTLRERRGLPNSASQAERSRPNLETR